MCEIDASLAKVEPYETEASTTLLLVMAKSRHKSVSAARKYFKPGAAVLAEVTSLLAPSDR